MGFPCPVIGEKLLNTAAIARQAGARKLLHLSFRQGVRRKLVDARGVIHGTTWTSWRDVTRTHTERTNFVTRLRIVRQNSLMIAFVCQSVCDGMSHAIGLV